MHSNSARITPLPGQSQRDKAIAEEKIREFVCLESTSPFGSEYLPDTTISQLLQGTDRKARGPDRGNLTPPRPLALFWD